MAFGFGKKLNLTGLDIGSSKIKAAEITETKKGYTLKKLGMIDIAPGAIEEGAIREHQVV